MVGKISAARRGRAQKGIHFIIFASDNLRGCEKIVLLLLAGLTGVHWETSSFHHDTPGLKVVNEAGFSIIRTLWSIGFTRSAPTSTRSRSMTSERAQSIFHAHPELAVACRHHILAARFESDVCQYSTRRSVPQEGAFVPFTS